MKAQHILIATVFILTVAGNGRADFVLDGVQHLDVTSSHSAGVLWESSSADVQAGGSVTNAHLNDDAVLTVSGGNVRDLDARNASRITISSGMISNILHAYDASAVTISGWGGVSSALYAHNDSTVDISDGWAISLSAYNDATVNVSGGTVHHLETNNDSTADISDGRIYSLKAHDTSSVVLSGGTVSDIDRGLSAFGASTVAISGGSVAGYVNAWNTSTMDISGGTISVLNAYEESSVTIHGFDFRATGGLSLDGEIVLGTGVLTGKWSDGTSWIMPIQGNDSGATIRVVPEPATLSLLALSGLAFLRRRRRYRPSRFTVSCKPDSCD